MDALRPEPVAEIAAAAAAAKGVDIEDFEVRRAGRRTLIRVIIDRDGGVDSDVSADVARAIRSELAADPRTSALDWMLEVTSPGIDRPLDSPRRWRRNVGRLVEIDLGGSTLTGRLDEVDDDGVTIRTGASDARRLRFAEMGRAVVQAELGPNPGGL